MLSLLVPFVVYNLALKAVSVLSRPGDYGLAQTLELMLSDVFFNLGYALLWIGLFAAIRRGPLRWVVVFLFHAATILVVVVTTSAHRYFLENGTTLDYGVIAAPNFEEIQLILVQRVPLSAWMLLAAALLYVALGPWLLARAVEWWRVRPRRSSPLAGTPRSSFLRSLGLWLLPFGLLLLALVFGWLSVSTGTTALARDPFVHVVLTGVEQANTKDDLDAGAAVEQASTEEGDSDADQTVEHPAAHASLAETSQTEKRNVVLVHLEAARAQSVTPYNEDLNTTPFLNELAKSGLLAERAHVVVPRSTLSNVAVNCGIEPPPRLGPEYHPGGVPVPCLAGLLKEQGYRTVFFSSNMDSFGDIATNNFGYEEVFAPPGESTPTQYWDQTMDTQSLVKTNSFSYEEDIMLGPSERWLREHKDEPFVAEYLTGTGHYEYQCLDTRYGSEDFSNDDLFNHYLNCMRLLDVFLENLIDQYKELGLYENTIFVFFGDHGEGLGEHGRFSHGDTIWDEGLRVPLIIHDPRRSEDGERVQGLSSHIDILPTVVEMLGYEVKDGKYPGYSLLHPLPLDRTLRFSCISYRKCLASIDGYGKYIYHYRNQPEEFFNLSKDPLERRNLASVPSKKELDDRREDLLAWLSRVDAEYGGE
ncbi:MAG: sulfatase-like hydrolase/transferase [Actinomycetota bacterium]|nr:sulfatase-like hydrolase/transferase [Actinomycetota bacterium]